MTEAGRGYAESCRRILDEIAEVERTASGEYHAPQGELVISMPPVMGRILVVPVIVEFLHAFPQIRVKAHLTDRFVNLVEERVDVAIRIGELPSSSLIGMPIGALREVVCASPDYLSKRGVPKKPEELLLHDCVGYEGYAIGNSWQFRSQGALHTVQVSSRLVLNSVEGAVVAAVEGAGIAKVASYQVEDLVKSRKLIELLDEFEPSPVPVSIMYAGQGQIPLKLRAFLDFAIPRLREKLGYEHPGATGVREPKVRRRSKSVRK
ncbi:LysR substrate-binding domain-containing protein [Cupriavidus sp. WKF15]|uniref:LysR substrate-binding domain-containing protein n=1 Tax=Cupriavidus sp. WKF15 TaxID=3032282 RepID=UPI0023E2C427|nr:LysR substrate-binding domain-containing protein [Cupriavidus sp. WKF15]WER50795.1 LysR substrate-binding domain-containing protein [Cupriavidus sp. WKF15]